MCVPLDKLVYAVDALQPDDKQTTTNDRQNSEITHIRHVKRREEKRIDIHYFYSKPLNNLAESQQNIN